MAEYSEWTDKVGRVHQIVIIESAADVTEEILEIAEEVEQGWFADEPQMDWERFWEKMDGYEVKEHDGREIDLGTANDTPAMRKIVKHIQRWRREG